jgi:hypothetical protein
MKTILRALMAALIAAPLCHAGESAKTPDYRRTLAVGFGYTGLIVRCGFKDAWAVETQYLFGQADSTDGDVSSQLAVVRGYRHFRLRQRLQLFAGTAIGYVTAKSTTFKSTGYLGGAFGGIEYYLMKRLSVGFDVGPYYFTLNEKTAGQSSSGVDFVVNSFLNFYIF